MIERREQCLVHELVTQSPVEALNEGVLLRFARSDIVPLDPCLLRPAQDGHAQKAVGDAKNATKEAVDKTTDTLKKPLSNAGGHIAISSS